MNLSETQMLLEKLGAYQKTVKEQHRLPKAKRDHKKLKEALTKSKTLLRWLKD